MPSLCFNGDIAHKTSITVLADKGFAWIDHFCTPRKLCYCPHNRNTLGLTLWKSLSKGPLWLWVHQSNGRTRGQSSVIQPGIRANDHPIIGSSLCWGYWCTVLVHLSCSLEIGLLVLVRSEEYTQRYSLRRWTSHFWDWMRPVSRPSHQFQWILMSVLNYLLFWSQHIISKAVGLWWDPPPFGDLGVFHLFFPDWCSPKNASSQSILMRRKLHHFLILHHLFLQN